MSQPITLLAIDPGYDRVGWAVGNATGSALSDISFGLIQTSAKDTLVARYAAIDRELSEIITKHHPQECAVESLFFYNNKTTAMHVAEARGVIISALFRHQVTFAEYTPLQIKQAVTGFGKADKVAVEKMVRLQLGRHLPDQKQTKLIDDTLDALAILLTHAASRQLRPPSK